MRLARERLSREATTTGFRAMWRYGPARIMSPSVA